MSVHRLKNFIFGKTFHLVTASEFEKLIEGQKEHPGLDFKASCPWDKKKLTKDILAMSNLPDGGYIVIGIEEDGSNFLRKGVTADDCKTYVLDTMRDQVSKFADPMVDFDVQFPEDSDGLTYIVIKVFSFRETPTLCKRDLDKELTASTIYYRNSNRRMESAAISNINDLRDLIELAAVRLMQRRRRFGFIVPESNHELHQKEIEAANEIVLVKLIKSRGHCEISVIPLATERLSSLSECVKLVEKAQVRLSWDFPFIPRHDSQGRVDTAESCYQGASEIGARKEFWRMHLSEHFYSLNAFVEDWLEGDIMRGSFAHLYPKGQFFFFYTTLLHHLTQVYTFIERLAVQGLYKEGAQISISFNQMADRKLHLDSDHSVPLVRERITKANKIIVEEQYSQKDLIEDSTRLSNAAILKVLEYFQFEPGADSIQIEQLKFLNDR